MSSGLSRLLMVFHVLEVLRVFFRVSKKSFLFCLESFSWYSLAAFVMFLIRLFNTLLLLFLFYFLTGLTLLQRFDFIF